MAGASPVNSAYLLLFKRDSKGRLLYFTLDNYAGIRINSNEVQVACGNHGVLKKPQQIITEIRARIADISNAYPNFNFGYLNPKIMNDHATPENTKFYFVSPRNPSGTNFINLPGGGANSGETPEQTVIREVSEELNIDITHIIAGNVLLKTITSAGKAIFIVDYDTLQQSDKDLFRNGNVASNRKTICGVTNIETSEAYYVSWRYYNQLRLHPRDNKFLNKFQEGLNRITPGGNQDIYYKKYLKYKAKYLKLKASMKI